MEEHTSDIKTEISPRIITCLGKLLMDTPWEDLISFMQKIGIRYTLCGNVCQKELGHHEARIILPQKGHYVGTSGISLKSAFCNALARFLLSEEHDFHDYKGLVSDKNYNENTPIFGEDAYN